MTNVDDVLHLSEISQIAITVSDLKRAQSFYQNTLGMRFLFESGTMVFFQSGVEFVDEPHLVARMPDHDLWLVFLKDPDGNVLGLMDEVNRAA
jgi:methylmalonyl-CoA/ethylmalonyl-CoA epimerase